MGALAAREARSAALRVVALEVLCDLVDMVYIADLRQDERDGSDDDGDDQAESSADAVARMRNLFLQSTPPGTQSGGTLAISAKSADSNGPAPKRGGGGMGDFYVERTAEWRQETGKRIVSLLAFTLASVAAAQNAAVREAAARCCGMVAVKIFRSISISPSDDGGTCPLLVAR